MLRVAIKDRAFFLKGWELEILKGTGDMMTTYVSSRPSTLSHLTPGYLGLLPWPMLFDITYTKLEIVYERIRDDEIQFNAGIERNMREFDAMVKSQIYGVPPAHSWLPQMKMFIDIEMYFVIAEELRKAVYELKKVIPKAEFQLIIQKHSQMLNTFRRIRGMLQHPEKEWVNPKNHGDRGMIDDGGFRFGGKHYSFHIEEVRKLKDELSDFFLAEMSPLVPES